MKLVNMAPPQSQKTMQALLTNEAGLQQLLEHLDAKIKYHNELSAALAIQALSEPRVAVKASEFVGGANALIELKNTITGLLKG